MTVIFPAELPPEWTPQLELRSFLRLGEHTLHFRYQRQPRFTRSVDSRKQGQKL
jgi:hypothetical protein